MADVRDGAQHVVGVDRSDEPHIEPQGRPVAKGEVLGPEKCMGGFERWESARLEEEDEEKEEGRR